jgi:uncharacterized membrane-anchored protein YhcB (DUF1043 family)
MTLEESIRFHTEEAEKMKLHKKVNEIILGTDTYKRELKEHTQTAEWLKELKAVKDLIKQHYEDSMPEDFLYIDKIREAVQE